MAPPDSRHGSLSDHSVQPKHDRHATGAAETSVGLALHLVGIGRRVVGQKWQVAHDGALYQAAEKGSKQPAE